MMIDFTEFNGPPRPEKRNGEPQCPDKLVAEHANGRKHEVLLDAASAQIIGRGHFGVIYSVTAKVFEVFPKPGGEAPFNEKRRAKEFPAVVKMFYGPKNAQAALSLYDVCKDAGLRVATTYRADLEKGGVIMTDFGIDDTYAISGNNWSLGAQALEKHPIERIGNWESVLARLFSEPLERGAQGDTAKGSEVHRATAYAIELQPDVYFFKVPKEVDVPDIEPVAGDFDIVRHPSDKDADTLLRYNVNALGAMCKLFIERFIREERQQEHLDALYRVCKSVLEADRV
ncbi:MAG: hypothetical protein WAZ27_02795 [Minisyncoccia bacterium]